MNDAFANVTPLPTGSSANRTLTTSWFDSMNCKRVTHVIVVKSRGKSVDVSPTFSVRGLWKVNINKALSPQTSSPFSSLLTVVHCDDNFTLPSITRKVTPYGVLSFSCSLRLPCTHLSVSRRLRARRRTEERVWNCHRYWYVHSCHPNYAPMLIDCPCRFGNYVCMSCFCRFCPLICRLL